MKIFQVRLINVKSYEDETVSFQDGLNFISGANGAGKTTVIESIGFALFDHLPYSVRQFVREGKRSGEIQVLFSGVDERLYRVIRKFNQSARTVKWEVYDEETGACLDELHGGGDVSLWIKENIGIDPADDLAKVFSQVIAVEQGLFSAPFLETAAKRRDVFEEIIKVQAYRNAFARTVSLVRLLEGQENAIASTIAGLQEAVAKIPLVNAELDGAVDTYARKSKELVAVQKEHEQHQKAEAQLAQLREKLEKSQLQEKLLWQDIQGQRELASSLGTAQQEAKLAAAKVEANLPAYQRYCQAGSKVKELEAKKAVKDRLARNLEQAEKAQATLRSAIDTASINLTDSRRQLAAEMSDVAARLERIKAESCELAADAIQLANWSNKTGSDASSYQRIKDWISQQEGTVFATSAAIRETENRLKQIGQRQNELKAVLQRENELAAIEQGLALERVLAEKAATESARQALLQNAEYLRQGKCPIVQDICPSHKVAGDLNQYLETKLQEFATVMDRLQLREEEERQKLAEYQSLQRALDQAKHALAELEVEQQRCQDSLAQTYRKAAETPVGILGQLLRKAESEEERLKELLLCAGRWLHERQWAKAGAELDLPSFDVGSSPGEPPTVEDFTHVKQQLSSLEEWLRQWEVWSAATKAWADRGSELIQTHQAWFTNWIHVLQLQRKEVKTHESTLSERLIHCQRQEVELNRKEEELGAKKVNLAKLTETVDGLVQRLQQYEGIEVALDLEKSVLAENLAGYEAYQANLQTASRLGSIQGQLAQTEKRIARSETELAVCRGTTARLQQEYDPEAHLRLRAQVQELFGRIQLCKADVGHLDKEISRLQSEKEQLDEKQKSLEENRRTLAVKVQTKDLAVLIRQVLKNAADPIAQIYRQHLSEQANVIFRQITNENVRLDWAEEYEVQLHDNHRGKERTRVFKQLSGGEQMAAALAIRLALMRVLSDVQVGFFDEPTTNLDEHRRQSLAQAIQNCTQDFEQLFVISHDDAFDALTDNTIVVHKDRGDGARTAQ